MYDDDGEFSRLDKADQTLYRYTKDERNFYNADVYNQLLEKYSNKENITVYRGVNFKSRLQYHKFMKKFNKDGGYITSNAAGFAKSYDTAEDFAETTKTFFVNLDVMKAEGERQSRGDKMTGFCGIVLKTTIKAGDCVDVTLSNFAVEDEVLFSPNSLIKCEVEIIDNYQTIVNDKNFSMNKYIQECNELNDPILNYITINHSDRINNVSASHLLELCLPSEETLEKRKNNYLKNSDREIVFDSKYLSVIKDYEYPSLRDFDKKEEFYHVTCPSSIMTYEDRGCFRPEQYKKIKEISSDMLLSFMECHYDLGQQEKIKSLKQLSWFSKFASSHLKDLYESTVLTRHGATYGELGDKGRSLNGKGLSREEMTSEVNKISEEIQKTLKSIISEQVPKITRKSKALSGIDKKKPKH
jgi:hypothetical protein